MFKSKGTVDPDIEKKIITSLIVSDRIASDLIPITKPELFKLDLAKTIFQWIKEFHETYHKAPKVHIQDIFLRYKDQLQHSDRFAIEEYLSVLSQEHENGGMNEDYLLEQGKNYLRQRHLLTTAEQIAYYAETGMMEEAEASMKAYGNVIDQGLSNLRKPFNDPKFMNSILNRKEGDTLFSLGGSLDELFGPLRKGWLMLWLGPMKRGKTWALQEVAMRAATNGCKTAFFSLEMEDVDISYRMYQQLNSSPEKDKEVIYPMFDCELNQKNGCNDKNRTNKILKPSKYTPNHPYQVCTHCRLNDPKHFIPTIWYHTKYRKALNRTTLTKSLSSFNDQYGSNLLRLKSYPIASANVQTIDRYLQMVELAEGWIPDVIIIDYADILMPEKKDLEGRDKENSTWLALKNLAQSRKAFVATASQGNRASFEMESLQEKNTSEDIRKLAHIDLAAAINQRPDEKIKGITRIAVLNHRWKKFNKSHQAMVLQNYEVGQFHLDSILIWHTGKGR